VNPASGQLSLLDGAAPDASDDPHGDAYCAAHAPASRRSRGITLTPQWLVELMVRAAAERGPFDTIVDAGAGSGRFIIAAARHFPAARLVAIEADPDMAGVLQQALHDAGLAPRVQVLLTDFRLADLPRCGRTLFLGNPPYVRHHDIGARWKVWYRDGMARMGIAASQLAGLHAHFFLRAMQLMTAGDVLLWVTSAEWLDNGYGAALRRALAGADIDSGAQLRALWLAASDEQIFSDALVSAVIVDVTKLGVANLRSAPAVVQLGRIAGRTLQPTRSVERATLADSSRWSPLVDAAAPKVTGRASVGDVFHVTRGQVTGLNAAWIIPPGSDLPGLTVSAVTRAREIIDGTVVAADATSRLRRVLNLPANLDDLDKDSRALAEQFIERARLLGAERAYVARSRTPWYAVAMRKPPDAFVSYMGRRPPVFMANPHQASFLNIAHGLYARQPMPAATLQCILDHLNTSTPLNGGRLYGGGLAKFEPSDIARLRIPDALLELD
jgi:adenine-specific DNA-methyltransferase